MGTKETVGALTLEDVKKYYTDNISPTVSSLVVVGDVAQEAIIPKINFLKNWKGNKVVHPVEVPLPASNQTKIYQASLQFLQHYVLLSIHSSHLLAMTKFLLVLFSHSDAQLQYSIAM